MYRQAIAARMRNPAKSATITPETTLGSMGNTRTSVEPNAAAPQNTFDTLGPIVVSIGTGRLLPRIPSLQEIVVSQRGFMFGPVGPVNMLGSWRSPHSPSYVSQANGPAGSISFGMST